MMDIVYNATDGENRLVIARTRDEQLYLAELSRLDDGAILEEQLWRGENAWADAQRWARDITGYMITL
jgi:hypothetical protein